MGMRVLSTRRKKAGTAPGTPVHVGRRKYDATRITVFEYDAAVCEERELASPRDCAALDRARAITWINVEGVHDVSTVSTICEAFGVHSLVQEDIVNTDQRPKVEEYDGYLFGVLKMARRPEHQEEIEIEQVSLLLLDGLVISFQERGGDIFEPVRNRLRTGKGSVRRRGPDYLAYCLMDAIVDHYYILLEQIEERIGPLEQQAIADPQPEIARSIQSLKRELLQLRRSLWPMREMVYRLSREEVPLIGEGSRVFLRDLYDHVIHIIEILETFQELVSSTMDIYLSSISNRMNNIMKVLTIIATIFIPLTFVAGVYGMNFVYMPELEWRWAYPATLGVMAGIAGVMLRFFRRKGWV